MSNVTGKFELSGDGSKALGAIKSVQRATHDLSHEMNTSLKDNIAEAFSIGVIIEAGSKMVEFADQTIKGANALDVTTDSFQALKIAARQANSDMSLFEKTFVNIEKAASDALGGDGKTKSIFKSLGVSDEDLRNLDKVSLLQKVLQGTQGMSRNQSVGDLEGLGVRGVNANQLVGVNNILGDFKNFKEGLKDNGQIADNESLNNVAELKDQWDDFTDSLRTQVLPSLSLVIGELTKFGRGLVQLTDIAGTSMGAILGNLQNLDGRKTALNLVGYATNPLGTIASAGAKLAMGDNSPITSNFNKEGADSINQILQEELTKFNNDDADFDKRSADRSKARADADAAREANAHRKATPDTQHSQLNDSIRGGDNSLIKIGALGGIDTAYRLARLSQEANNYLKTIADKVTTLADNKGAPSVNTDFESN